MIADSTSKSIIFNKMAANFNYYNQKYASQVGGWADFPVYQGLYQYGSGLGYPVFRGRSQYGQGFGDVLRGIWRFFRPVAMAGAKTLLKAGSEALTDGATVKQVLANTLKPTVGTLLTATADQVANRLNPTPQEGSGKRKRKRGVVYKIPSINKKRKSYSKPVYNF
jgi:hypothetical protein